jgi:hypothetical protein
MSKKEEFEVISTYTQGQAIEDGILVKICDIRWNGELKPYVATAHIYDDIGYDGAMDVWYEFVNWRNRIMLSLPEEEQMFSMIFDDRKIWVIEDGAGFTLMYPEDY